MSRVLILRPKRGSHAIRARAQRARVRAEKLLLIAEGLEERADRVLEYELALSSVEIELGLRVGRRAS